MKIAYINPDLGIRIEGEKGAAAHMRGLIATFESAGHDVDYAAPTADTQPDAIFAPEPGLFEGLPAVSNKRVTRALRHIWANAGVEQALLKAFGAAPPDLIYERYGPFAVAGGIVAKALGIPHILEVNSPLAREGAQYRNQALGDAAEALELCAFENTGAIVAVSDELKSELIEYGVPAQRIHVIPNGVNCDMFSPSGPKEVLPEISGPTFGFVGGLRPWHGIADMVTAFRSVAERLNARLLVIGDGPERTHIEDLTRDLPERVIHMGAVSHNRIPPLMRTVDIALAPYPTLDRFYYSPLKILEYMAAGRAVIASDIGQVGQLISDGKTGRLVPSGNPDELARVMLELGSDPHECSRLGNAAARVAKTEHDWSQRAEQIIRIARSLTSAQAKEA